MGNVYAGAVSKGLKYMSHEVVKLSDNRLTSIGAQSLIKRLKPAIKYLDLSNNMIGVPPIRELATFLKFKATK